MSPAASQIRTLEEKNEQRKKPSTKNDQAGNNKSWKNDEGHANARGQKSCNGYRNIGNRGAVDNTPDSHNYNQSHKKLPRLENIPAGTCIKCLSAQHNTPACTVYARVPICRSVCVYNGRPHGFHWSKDCSMRQNSNTSFRGRQRPSYSRTNNSQSRVFRPFRVNK